LHGGNGVTETIDDICRRVALSQPDSLEGCNYYVQAVFRAIYGDGQDNLVGGIANTIVRRLRAAPFNPLGFDAIAAVSHAANGDLVVGGLANPGYAGHVFIVQSTGLSVAGRPTPWVSGGRALLSPGGAPRIFNGSSNTKIPKPETSVDIVFSRADQTKVIYAWLPDPRTK
jgi:hypothetical protein